MADTLADKIRSLGYNPSYNIKNVRERVDEVLALIVKDPTPTTATLILFGQACERLKWEATDVDNAVRQDTSDRLDIAREIDELLKASTQPT